MGIKTGSYEVARNGARPRTRGRYAAYARSSPMATMQANGLPYQEVGAFLRDLRQEQGIAARAMEFIVLSACRVSEAGEAAWSEFDFQARVWTIPAERSKSGKTHRIPLSDEAIALLDQVRGCDPEWVLPGLGKDEAGDLALRRVVERLGRPAAALRGARTALRNWMEKRTQHSEAALALCLGHRADQTGSGIATFRPEHFDDCRSLMADWARWCATVQTGA